jgi:plasmid stabilization system protein ParE
MGRVLRTNRATEDLVDIFAEAAGRSSALVERRRAAFARTLALLSDNPGLGSRRLAQRPDVRVFPCDRYLLFYRRWQPATASTFCGCGRRRATGWRRSTSPTADRAAVTMTIPCYSLSGAGEPPGQGRVT